MKKGYMIVLGIMLILIIALSIICFILINNRKIKLEIKEGTLTETSAVLIINHEYEPKISFGEFFFIEKKEGLIWKELEAENLATALIGYTSYGKGATETKVNWAEQYGKLKKGKYRIKKYINGKLYSVKFKIK